MRSSALVTVLAHDETHTVIVGKWDRDSLAGIEAAWTREGWRVEMTYRQGSRMPLRAPYVPVRCDRCRWAGRNLGRHYLTAHGEPYEGNGPKVAEVTRRQAMSARATTDRNRIPRIGIVVVKQTSDRDAEVFRISELAPPDVVLYPLRSPIYATARDVAGRFTGARIELLDEALDAGETERRISIDELMTRYLPVGQWQKGG